MGRGKRKAGQKGKKQEIIKAIHKEYGDPTSPFALGGIKRMRQKFKHVSRKDMKKVLSSNIGYNLHKDGRKRFKTRKIRADARDHIWTADLQDVQNISKFNDGVTFLFVILDVVSKFLWVEPLKNKTSESIAEAFTKVVVNSGRKPGKLFTDLEFRSKKVMQVLADMEISLYHTGSPLKASIAERMIRTLRKRLGRFFTLRSSYRYIDDLQSFVDSYNRTLHTSIKMRPIDVNLENQHIVLNTLYNNIEENTSGYLSIFNQGDTVRIQALKSIVAKEYYESWSRETFNIYRVHNKTKPIMYTLKDFNGEEISGRFYKEELIGVEVAKDATYAIEKIISRKGKGKHEQVLVRWVGWGPAFDSYIYKRDLIKK
jgi:hypothetical protein